ncbi:ABC transporter substrate-binding protein [Bacillus sp. OK048]|uniref:ABC transporter substrate-binding protein n=1 Tax=Bacillus sp. OK048 TaxID=1882761 RepID=UPI0008822575|nr:ABC transporter substrate-binding protein [Bacillus sp. OK048]SDL92292.1 putative spermidine/putrescine transport system substrate-binding protein [Bacillus sp. OK048]
MRKSRLINSIMLVLILILTGCTSGNKEETKPIEKNTLTSDWKDIEANARGTKVNFYLWGGDEGINRYIDEWVAPRLKEQFGVELKRYPMDATEFINKLMTEKKANKTSGEMDVLWVNGENFKTAKQQELLLGPFTEKLPNFQQFVDTESDDIKYDFGFPIEGYEAPWGKVQFVFAYDSSKIANPPRSIDELQEWVRGNPGKFTYPAPPDFTGSAFVRHVLHEKSENYSAYLNDFDKSLIESESKQVWNVLNDMKPFLWREGKSYPQSISQLEQLYKNGEVWMTMGYDEANASNLIKSGEFPETTKTFILDKGTLANTHFLAIPYNAPNANGALVLINYLLSPEAQLKKMDLEYWGEMMSLSVDKLSDEDKKVMESIDRGRATLSQEELSSHRAPEIGADYVQWLERGWIENVAKK